MKFLLVLSLSLLSLTCLAKEKNAPVDLNSLNVEGTFEEKPTNMDRLKKVRAELEKRNELMVKKQIESMRLKQEILMMQKIRQAFEQTQKNLEQI